MRIVVAVASILMILGALFYLRLRTSPAVVTGPISVSPAPTVPPATPPFVTRDVTPSPAPAPSPSPSPPGEPDPSAAPPRVTQALDAARAAMRTAAARDCRVQSRDVGQHLRFRYKLDVSSGSAQASRVEKLDSDIVDQELLSCLLTSLGKARWTYMGPDATLMAEEDWPLAMLNRP